MGMFSAMQAKDPNATICYLSCKMRCRKNRTVGYLDGLSQERRDEVLRKAVQLGKKQRRKRRMNEKELRAEVLRRVQEKAQAREMTERRKVDKKLKTATVDTLASEFPEVTGQRLENLKVLFKGEAVGQLICHTWYEEGVQVVYSGKIEDKFTERRIYKYRIAYWANDESYEDAEDYDMAIVQLCADFIEGDLVF